MNPFNNLLLNSFCENYNTRSSLIQYFSKKTIITINLISTYSIDNNIGNVNKAIVFKKAIEDYATLKPKPYKISLCHGAIYDDKYNENFITIDNKKTNQPDIVNDISIDYMKLGIPKNSCIEIVSHYCPLPFVILQINVLKYFIERLQIGGKFIIMGVTEEHYNKIFQKNLYFNNEYDSIKSLIEYIKQVETIEIIISDYEYGYNTTKALIITK